MVLVVPRGHPLADPAEPVDLRKLSETSRWMAAPAGEPSRQAVDRLLAGAGGVPAMPWEFEGLGTIMSLVSRGIGVAAVPRLALAAGEGRVVVRELPGAEVARDVYAVARTASVRRPSVAVILAALHSGAKHLPGRRPLSASTGSASTGSASTGSASTAPSGPAPSRDAAAGTGD
jgi:DNA-binding transcriptional LysR family regulator